MLEALGLPFTVVSLPVPEQALPGEGPAETAKRLAREKAQAVASRFPHALVVGCDTIVVMEGAILGKPADATEAKSVLRCLAGREHQVLSGLAVANQSSGRLLIGCVQTLVKMREYDDRWIDEYVASRLPLDKAGAYGIQDNAFRPVESIRGCFCNVVGLPLHALAQMLTDLGVKPACLPSGCCAYREHYSSAVCQWRG